MAKTATKSTKPAIKQAKSAEKLVENDPFLYSISALSRKFKLDRATVRERLENAEIKPKTTKAKEKLYHLDDVEIVLAQSELNEAKLDKLKLEAEKLAHDLAVKRSEFAPVGEMTEAIQKLFGRMYKECVVNLPKQLARQAHEANNSAEVQEIIQNRYAKLFDDLRVNFKKYL